MNEEKKIIPLTAIAILLLSMAPMAYASMFTVNLNPKTGLAKVDSASTTKIVFTYPAGSTVSTYLKNVSSSSHLKGAFNGGTPGALELQASFDQEDSKIKVKNMSVAVDYTAKGNATALVVNAMMSITAWVTGAFSVANGSVKADVSWRSFEVNGAMEL